jgi:hypothetical protein
MYLTHLQINHAFTQGGNLLGLNSNTAMHAKYFSLMFKIQSLIRVKS